MEESIRYWKNATTFFKRGDHLLSANLPEHVSKIVAYKNDGRTIYLHYDDRSVIASNVGDMDVIIKYDVRPNSGGYKFIDGRYIPHPRGDVKIEGYYPDYRIAGLFIRVYIGPHLHFYPEPQEDIILLARRGELMDPPIAFVRHCLTCEREIAKELGPRAKYCSVECGLVTRHMLRQKQFARAEEKRFKLPEVKPERKCQTCGGAMPKELNGRFKYCSVECGLMTRDMSPLPKMHPCDYCGTLFSRKGPKRFCSEPCKLKDKLKCLES